VVGNCLSRALLVLSAAVLVQATASAHAPSSTPAPAFDGAAHRVSENGVAFLEWQATGAEQYEVESSDNVEFARPETVYRGTFTSAHVSGLLEGTHYFRVRAGGEDVSDWSSTAVVVVEHHPWELVWPLFGLGAAVFAATCVVVLRGASKGPP
jgi:hypothetical protein